MVLQERRRGNEPRPEGAQPPGDQAIIFERADPKRDVGSRVLHVLKRVTGSHDEPQIRVMRVDNRKQGGRNKAAKFRRRGNAHPSRDASAFFARNVV